MKAQRNASCSDCDTLSVPSDDLTKSRDADWKDLFQLPARVFKVEAYLSALRFSSFGLACAARTVAATRSCYTLE